MKADDLPEMILCQKCGHVHQEDYDCQFVSLDEIKSDPLLRDMVEACVDLYMQTHVSTVRNQIAPIQKLWEIGQELYLSSIPKSQQPGLENQ